VAALSILVTAGGSPAEAAQAVTSLTLLNADTDQPIAGYDPMPSGATLNLATLPTTNLNIRANTSPITVGSVRFALDGNSNYRTETAPPYALAGDTSADYWKWTPSVGNHTLKVTPYAGAGGTGTAGSPLTIAFSVQAGSSGGDGASSGASSGDPSSGDGDTPAGSGGGVAVTALTLINADNNQPISGFNPLASGAVLDLATLPSRNINIAAKTNPTTVGSVHFALDSNADYHSETAPPYSLAGDTSGNYEAWTPTLGTHKLVVTPYQLVKGSWTAGTAATLTFTVQDSGAGQVCK
jgi:hypothetical protein